MGKLGFLAACHLPAAAAAALQHVNMSVAKETRVVVVVVVAGGRQQQEQRVHQKYLLSLSQPRRFFFSPPRFNTDLAARSPSAVMKPLRLGPQGRGWEPLGRGGAWQWRGLPSLLNG